MAQSVMKVCCLCVRTGQLEFYLVFFLLKLMSSVLLIQVVVVLFLCHVVFLSYVDSSRGAAAPVLNESTVALHTAQSQIHN